VLNRATMRGGVSPDDIEHRLRVPLASQVPDDQPLVTHSVNRGVPLMLSHQRSAVARAVQHGGAGKS
jgi:pilus assembly protein CpaE